MNVPRPTDKPGRSNPVSTAAQYPPELQWMLRPAGDNPGLREAIVRAYYGAMEGAQNSVAVQEATLLSAVYSAILHDNEGLAQSLPDHLRASAAEQARLICQELRGQAEENRKGEQAERDKHRDLLNAHLEELRRQSVKVHSEKATLRNTVANACAITAMASVILGGLGMHWMDGKQKEDSARSAMAEATRWYAQDQKALSSGAQFLSQLNEIGGGADIQSAKDGRTMVTLSFGKRSVADAHENELGQAVIDLNPYAASPPPPLPVPTARQTSAARSR